MPKLRTLGSLVRDIDLPVRELDWIENTEWGNPVRPERLPKPSCKVWLVCGPPASGKSTFVRMHADPNDIVIDLDGIAREYGMGRERPSEALSMLLLDRNDRLAALANESADCVAWVIMGAATEELRNWWCKILGVKPECLVLLMPPREELHRRIMSDPDRRSVQHLHMRLVDKWLAQEQHGKTTFP